MIALLLAAPFERGRNCDVCPVDCPMHAQGGRAKHLGCHQSGDAHTARAPMDDGACAMRASCGHRQHASPSAFAGELAPVVVAAPLVPRGRVFPIAVPRVGGDEPAPPDRPPESPVV